MPPSCLMRRSLRLPKTLVSRRLSMGLPEAGRGRLLRRRRRAGNEKGRSGALFDGNAHCTVVAAGSVCKGRQTSPNAPREPDASPRATSVNYPAVDVRRPLVLARDRGWSGAGPASCRAPPPFSGPARSAQNRRLAPKADRPKPSAALGAHLAQELARVVHAPVLPDFE